MIKKWLNVNGTTRMVVASADETLANVIREQLGLTGTKVGCGEGQCGACSVTMNGKLVRSCVTKMSKVPDNASILTIEGVGTPEAPHPIQKSWMLHGGAQCGFCTPGFIVSTKALLDKKPDPSRDDVRDWFQVHRNACRCTGYKQLVDAVMDASKVMRGEMDESELEFKMPESGEIWGTNYPRPSALAKVTGTLDYGADLGLKMPPDTLYMELVQAKVSHANILSIDTSEAEKMPGVAKVVTHKDIKGKNRFSGLIVFPTNLGDGWDRPILCDEKVFQYGDAIAIVCADTEAQAKAAAEKVKVELEELPAYMSAPEAMAEDAIEIHPGTPNVYYYQKIAKGPDTGPIFEKAPVVVEDDFYTSRQPHLPIEPDVGFAYYNDEGKLCIHSKSVSLYLHALLIAPGLGVEPEDIIMVQNPAGGTFGYKGSATMEALLGAACMATGRPVFLRYNYHQQQAYTGKRSPFFVNLRLAADKDGKLLAMESDFSVDHGPYSELGDILTMKGAQYMGAGYDIPAIRGEGRTVCTNHVWGSAFRGFGSPESMFPSEVLMDELAEKLGMDPFDLRYKNVYRPGSTTPTGQEPEVFPFPEMLDALKPKYQAALKSTKANSDDKTKRGVGLALGIFCCQFDGPDTSEVRVELNPDNTVTLYATWEDHGQGADAGALGTMHQALRPLGLAPDQIKLAMNDTSIAPNSGASAASRQQVVTGRAIQAGCDLLLAAMKKDDGSFRTYDEMQADGKETVHTGIWTSPGTYCDENCQGSPSINYQYGVVMSEVAVDMASGKTQVEKMTMLADVGKVCNRLVLDGQLYGGMAQGVGLALTEDYEDIQKHSSLMGAGLPYIKDIPDDMELIYIETPREEGPFGASGAGEMPLCAPHSAIVNAIYNACGARVTHLPARPEKVLAALKDKK